MQHSLPDFELERFLPYRLTVISGRLSDALAKQYKRQFGISIPEWRVLMNVGYSDNLSIRDIEARVNLEKSKVSRAASKLEAKGYLTKHIGDKDRRLLRLTLTQEGVALLEKLIPIAQAFQDTLDAKLGPNIDALQSALDALMSADE